MPLAVKKGCEIMVRSADFPRIGWNTVFSSQNIRIGGKDVLEAVFAVKVEAGDGMQQPSSIV